MKKIIAAIILINLLLSCSSNKQTNEVVQPTKEQEKVKTNSYQSIYDFNYQTPEGKQKSLKYFKGQVILIVNTASQCGLTPQFEGLENLHKTYSKKGLVVLGLPCNQFDDQEPLTDKEMVAACKENHGVTFELTKKIEVNGKNEMPLYTFLKSQQKLEENNDIRWNFEKFLVNRQGIIIKRFAPQTTPEEITSLIEELL